MRHLFIASSLFLAATAVIAQPANTQLLNVNGSTIFFYGTKSMGNGVFDDNACMEMMSPILFPLNSKGEASFHTINNLTDFSNWKNMQVLNLTADEQLRIAETDMVYHYKGKDYKSKADFQSVVDTAVRDKAGEIVKGKGLWHNQYCMGAFQQVPNLPDKFGQLNKAYKPPIDKPIAIPALNE